MDATNQAAQGTTQEPSENRETDSQEIISNSELKSHPVFQKLTARLSQYEKAEQERRQQEEAAAAAAAREQQEAEMKALEEQNKFKEIIALKDKTLEQLQAEHTRELNTLLLKNELVRSGFKNDYFLDGVISRFKGTKEDIPSFLEVVMSDEQNKAYIAAQSSSESYTPPSIPGVANANNIVPVETIKAWEQSSDRELRQKARIELRKYREKHGRYPY